MNASTGAQFFAAANSAGKAGLASLPYVSIQNTGVLVATGAGPSIELSASLVPDSMVKERDASKPYVVIDANNGMGIAAPIPRGKWIGRRFQPQGIVLSYNGVPQ